MNRVLIIEDELVTAEAVKAALAIEDILHMMAHLDCKNLIQIITI